VHVVHPSGDVTTYAYNGGGLRVSQDDGVVETRYVHDGNNVLLKTDDVGTVEAEFTYIPQEYSRCFATRTDKSLARPETPLRNHPTATILTEILAHCLAGIDTNSRWQCKDFRFEAFNNH